LALRRLTRQGASSPMRKSRRLSLAPRPWARREIRSGPAHCRGRDPAHSKSDGLRRAGHPGVHAPDGRWAVRRGGPLGAGADRRAEPQQCDPVQRWVGWPWCGTNRSPSCARRVWAPPAGEFSTPASVPFLWARLDSVHCELGELRPQEPQRWRVPRQPGRLESRLVMVSAFPLWQRRILRERRPVLAERTGSCIQSAR
jgi:hypothetical protein